MIKQASQIKVVFEDTGDEVRTQVFVREFNRTTVYNIEPFEGCFDMNETCDIVCELVEDDTFRCASEISNKDRKFQGFAISLGLLSSVYLLANGPNAESGVVGLCLSWGILVSEPVCFFINKARKR